MKIKFESDNERKIVETILSKIVENKELRFSEMSVVNNILFDIRKETIF